MSDWYYVFPTAIEMYTVLLAHLNSAFNPIFYGIFNPNFTKGYQNVFRWFSHNEKLCMKISISNKKYTVDTYHEPMSNRTAKCEKKF